LGIINFEGTFLLITNANTQAYGDALRRRKSAQEAQRLRLKANINDQFKYDCWDDPDGVRSLKATAATDLRPGCYCGGAVASTFAAFVLPLVFGWNGKDAHQLTLTFLRSYRGQRK